MTCKACGRHYGCNHSDAEYQGVAPVRRRIIEQPRRVPRQRPEAPGSVPVRPDRPRHDDGGASVEPEREPA